MVKVGLEIHTYLEIPNNTKLFCNCKLNEIIPNIATCPVCTGQPGSKPMLPNKEALDAILRISLMLNCKINKKLMFQRKHYSWPDLPMGFQKTMSGTYSSPVAVKGKFLGIGIQQVHLEEDPARWDPLTGKVDYNRSGFPLAEIVTDPDFKSSEEVYSWIKNLITTLSYINAVNKKAGIKVDVNVSIPPKFQRVEIKNINSFTSIINAIDYEEKRQGKEEVKQETRAWDVEENETVFMRSKEGDLDYMFIPEPDLPEIQINNVNLEKLKKQIPESPNKKLKKFLKLKVDKTNAKVISNSSPLAELYEQVIKKTDPKLASNWFRRDIIEACNNQDLDFDDIKVTPKNIIELIQLVKENKLNQSIAKEILEKLVKNDFNIKEYIKKNKLESLTDNLNKYCKEAIKESEQAVKEYKSGQEKAINSIVGKVMSKTKGKANPGLVKKTIEKLL